MYGNSVGVGYGSSGLAASAAALLDNGNGVDSLVKIRKKKFLTW
jgi:hypothetical protein